MATTDIGKEAEELVAKSLKKNGHKIVAMNWRTRRCEIDVISTKKKCVYFTEVKYRSSDAWGDGMNYITPQKLKQMHFAAEMWLAQENWKGESTLQAASVNVENKIELLELSL